MLRKKPSVRLQPSDDVLFITNALTKKANDEVWIIPDFLALPLKPGMSNTHNP